MKQEKVGKGGFGCILRPGIKCSGKDNKITSHRLDSDQMVCSIDPNKF